MQRGAPVSRPNIAVLVVGRQPLDDRQVGLEDGRVWLRAVRGRLKQVVQIARQHLGGGADRIRIEMKAIALRPVEWPVIALENFKRDVRATK
jgi:hypothetical protein